LADTANMDAPARAPWWQVFLIGRNPRVTLVRLVVVVVSAFVTFKYVLVPIRVTGTSMEPAYRNGQVNFVNRLSFRFRPPERGDVVAIRTTGLGVMLLKRLIALPGERVRIEAGQVYVNGEPLEEPYIPKRAPWFEREFELGPDEYFVIGDNRTMSQRDHTHGATTRDRLVGRTLW
jgi:signal peptidase I